MIIEHPEIAAYYTRVFLDDWDATEEGGTRDIYGVDRLKMVAAACILAGLMALYLYRRGRS